MLNLSLYKDHPELMGPVCHATTYCARCEYSRVYIVWYIEEGLRLGSGNDTDMTQRLFVCSMTLLQVASICRGINTLCVTKDSSRQKCSKMTTAKTRVVKYSFVTFCERTLGGASHP